MGFERVWFVEHHFLTEWAHCSASEVMLAAVSQHTTTMRLGFGVILLPVHHPLHVASKTATLDVLSGGRVDVGVGRSGNPYQIAPFGIQLEDTRGIWEESLSMLPNIWTQQVYSHQGKYFNVPEREVIPKPFQNPHPPLWSACSQDDTFQRAGELGIGCTRTDRKSTRLNSSHLVISYAVFCLKKKKNTKKTIIFLSKRLT